MSAQMPMHIDTATKQRFDQLCDDIGILPSAALELMIQHIIDSHGAPLIMLQYPPQNKPKLSRQDVFGCMRGQFRMAKDFDAPLEDFKEYME